MLRTAHRFNAEGPEGLTDRPRAGRPRQLTDAQMAELAEIVESGSTIRSKTPIRSKPSESILRGARAALMLPRANTGAMQMHLDEISRNLAARAHAVVLMDRAGWHKTGKLKLPNNLSIILLPSRAPELNPVESVWQYLRQNWLSNRVFEDYQTILDAGCRA